MNLLPVAIVLVLAQSGGTSFDSRADADAPPEHRERLDACVGHLESLALKKAEACYASFYKDLPSSPLADEALYDLALARERQGNRDGALTTRTTLVDGYPRSPLAPQTKLDVAEARVSEGDLLAAAELFTSYARRYPRAPRASEQLERAAIIYAAFEKHRRSRRAHESTIELFSRTDGIRALDARAAIPWLLIAEGAEQADVDAAFDASSDHARRVKNTAATIRADVEKARWRDGLGDAKSARKLFVRATQDYEDLDDDALSSTSAETFDAVAFAYLSLARQRMTGLAAISEKTATGTARKRLRANIRSAQSTLSLLNRALDAGVLVSSADDISSYGSVPNRHKPEILFLMARIDERILEGALRSKLNAKRQASYLEARMGVSSIDELAARTRGRYLRILQDVESEGRLTVSAYAAIERLSILSPEEYPRIEDMLPTPSFEHDAEQGARFEELGARPTL